MATTVVSALMHDGDDRASLGLGDTVSHADLLVGNLMIIKTSDIDSASSEGNDTNVVTENFTIGTTIDKCIVHFALALLVVGNMICALVGTNQGNATGRGAFAHGHLPLDGAGIML